MTILSLLLLLLSNAVALRREKSILYCRITILIFISCSLIAIKNLDMPFLSEGLGLYGGLFHATAITQVFHIFIFFLSAIILQLTAFYPRKLWVKNYANLYVLLFSKITFDTNLINKMGQQFRIIEYPLVMLFIVLGGTFLVSASDIVSIFLSIELQSYGLYLLCTLYRNSELSTSAGLVYFLLGGLSSCFILLGTSILYANSGTTSLDGYYVITGLSSITNEYASNMFDYYKPLYLNISLLIMSVGFLFKISAAPFHFWSPDVYDAIPTIVTTFVATIAKISILIFLLELVHYTSNFYFAFNFNWTSGLLFSSLLSLIIGAVLGLTQFRIKRLFAYSTISHLGFILLALTINSLESIQAFLFYVMQYSISNLNAFVLLVSIGFSLYPYVQKKSIKNEYKELLDKNNSPIQLTRQLKGYFYLNPLLALSLTITLFSFVGIPPLMGFFAKQMVLSAALDSGFVFLALIAILTSVISAVYYLSIIKEMFFDEHDYKGCQGFENISLHATRSLYFNTVNDNTIKRHVLNISNITLSSCLTVTISILTLLLLLFIFLPHGILDMNLILALIMFNP
uniref:NADH-ubiquinone oxidoreductase chain 2 n=1 Tax=Lecanora strobilina TaxID=1518595 RepID=A0A166AU88_9LECA|nr:NADH dehydrogenase subunit 2 [Lecanora strobilina]AMZ84232.1 NADH dehydrogenase subunit 2 [Lecanora strobilina]